MTSLDPAADLPSRPAGPFAGRLDRYADPTRPTVGQAWSDLWRRALLPAVGLLALVTGLGFLIVGPLGGLPAETAVNEWLVERRVPVLDSLTAAWSLVGSTEIIIGGCLLVFGIAWWATREWWFAIIPGVAVAIQAAVFMLSALLVGRERPDVEMLDDAPPTSSFPSGHTGAATAFWLSTALLAQRIHATWLRVLVTVVCVAVPLLVAFSRLYRGMHHVSDVVVGALNGLVCVWLAWHYLRREPQAETAP
ncbi:phosphatase PAP2 family protein [Actinotalea sp. M2MS4P-6]|uniref:phosphatase PAP2 family protein n=1 Tax=Actinotalea sp. M2MS4P-6 TaxID=2983762 RepID=UPI0021E3D00E|nr:phosphatase PAP2 family protein [Actinotalea sp. M2MS4P-6]MCV2396056.1 phosphatase PAP2 family protein [Actinotalea sp. M2MS4P-6]